MMCIASMKNMTYAQRGCKSLRAAGVECTVVSLEPTLTKNGCAYGLSFPARSEDDARRLLSSRRVSYGELIVR